MPSFDFERQSFQEAIDHFRQKTNIPTERWDELAGEEHDVAFVVAGAAKADLLADLRQAVDRAVANGTTRAQFAQEFEGIAARAGWAYKGEKNWRAGVIYQTNTRSAHAAGRWAQLTDPDMLKARPYWQWVHGDSVSPRPAHLALHRKIFPADSVFWREMFPPQGFGCKCQVVSLSKAEVKREGLAVEDAPEVGAVMEAVDRAGVPQFVPVEPAPGFGAAPGATRPEQRQALLRDIRSRLPDALRESFDAEMAQRDRPVKDIEATATDLAAALGVELTPEVSAALKDRLPKNPSQGQIMAILSEFL